MQLLVPEQLQRLEQQELQLALQLREQERLQRLEQLLVLVLVLRLEQQLLLFCHKLPKQQQR